MNPSANTFPFNVRVVEARGLYASRRDIADPFVVVKLKGLKHIFNSEKQTSDVKMNNENPVFNQDFTLHPKETDTILVKVMDKNTPINRKLGKVLIPVQSYLNRGIVDSWFPLEGKAGKAGEVHILLNYGGKGFTGFKDYLSSKSSLGNKTSIPAPVAAAALHKTPGTTTVKETEILKSGSRDASFTADRPILPPSQTVPLSAAPIAPTSGMQNLNLGAPSTTSQMREPIKNVILSRDTVVQERIHPVEEEIVQPIIHRERQQTEIHRVTQNVNEAQVLPTLYQEKTLAAEYRDYNKTRDFLAEETNTRSAAFSSRDVDATRHTKVVNAPIVEETIKKTVIEVVQPVVHRETTAPVVIRETLPIYEKVIEEPIIYNDVRTATSINMGTAPLQSNMGAAHLQSNMGTAPLQSNLRSAPFAQQQQQPGMLVKETVISSTTLEPNTFGAKVPPTTQTNLNQAHQSF